MYASLVYQHVVHLLVGHNAGLFGFKLDESILQTVVRLPVPDNVTAQDFPETRENDF